MSFRPAIHLWLSGLCADICARGDDGDGMRRWTERLSHVGYMLCAGPRYCGNLYSIFGPEGGRKYLATFPVPGYRDRFQHEMHQDVIGDRVHPDMHAFLAFHFLEVPVLPHLCNW